MATIQVISQADFTKQDIAQLTSAEALPPLPPSSVRIRTRLISLTTNNLSYAKLGGFRFPGLTWWDVWPTPSNLPAPLNDESKYCRISAWGSSEVVESNIDSLPVGTHLFGYQPIGTEAEILELKQAGVEGHWIEVTKRRESLLPIYNRYVAYPNDGSATEEERISRGWDSLMKLLFETSYSLNSFGFSEIPDNVINPSGYGAWSAEDASLKDAVVVLLAPSGKTGLAFAYQLQHRGSGNRAKKVVAVGSANSRAFTTQTGFFDDVIHYDDVDKADVLDKLLEGTPEKVVLVNFGARGDAADKWAEALRPKTKRLQVVLVGGDIMGGFGASDLQALAADPTSGVVQANAGGLRESAIKKLGEEVFFGAVDESWNAFKAAGGVPGLKFIWGKNLADVKAGWDGLVSGEHGPDVGLLYELSQTGPCSR
ncbi:hypothetical protein OQA88_10878 [Cercophora sp. LCS_1]